MFSYSSWFLGSSNVNKSSLQQFFLLFFLMMNKNRGETTTIHSGHQQLNRHNIKIVKYQQKQKKTHRKLRSTIQKQQQQQRHHLWLYVCFFVVVVLAFKRVLVYKAEKLPNDIGVKCVVYVCIDWGWANFNYLLFIRIYSSYHWTLVKLKYMYRCNTFEKVVRVSKPVTFVSFRFVSFNFNIKNSELFCEIEQVISFYLKTSGS